MNKDIIIEVKNLHKRFGANEVLRGINTTVSRGEVIAIIGPSGCGKSTFFRSPRRHYKGEVENTVLSSVEALEQARTLAAGTGDSLLLHRLPAIEFMLEAQPLCHDMRQAINDAGISRKVCQVRLFH